MCKWDVCRTLVWYPIKYKQHLFVTGSIKVFICMLNNFQNKTNTWNTRNVLIFVLYFTKYSHISYISFPAIKSYLYYSLSDIKLYLVDGNRRNQKLFKALILHIVKNEDSFSLTDDKKPVATYMYYQTIYSTYHFKYLYSIVWQLHLKLSFAFNCTSLFVTD